MSKIWLCSDHHFRHEAIIGYCDRLFNTTKNMNRYMIERHNSVVKDEDTVYFLGDVCFTHDYKDLQSILKQMKGHKNLIIGNHDKLYIFDYIEAGFTSVHTSLILDGFLLLHDPAFAGVAKNYNVIHGHTHGLGLRLASNTYCVCVELHDYTPVDFQTIKENW